MKKFLAIFLVLILLFSFAACNKDDDTNTDGTTTTENQAGEQTTDGEEDTTNKKPNRFETTTAAPFENPNITEPAALFKIVDVNNYTHKSADPNTTKSSGVTFIINRYENKNSLENTLSTRIYVEDTELVLSETLLKDFVAKGWTIVSKQDANTAIEAGKGANVYLRNSQGKTIKVTATNKTSISTALGDCVITEISAIQSIEQQNWADFTIDGKAGTTNIAYADFVNAFGKPKTINATEYYKGNDYTHSKVSLLFEQKIGNETLSISVAFDDKATGDVKLQSFVCKVR